MFVRVAIYTLVLGGTVVLHFVWGRPEVLGGQYITVLFIFIAAIYLINILYALAIKFAPQHLFTNACVQVGVDLLSSALLVHFTGGTESAFIFLFLLSPIAAAVTLQRRGAFLAAVGGPLLLSTIIILGYYRIVPPLPGQQFSSWNVSIHVIVRSLLVYGSATIAVGALAGYLAEQLRTAAQHVVEQQAHIDRLSALNSDIIRCLTSGLVTVSANGTILSLNQAAAEILDLDQRENAVGKRLEQQIPEFATVVASPTEHRRVEIVVNTRIDRRILGLSLSSLTDQNNRHTGWIINFQDLTAMRQLEQTMKRSEHLASLGRLAAGVAHEIRNPLASISGSLELLRTEDRITDEGRQLMEIALREIERLDSLIADLLQYARPRPPKLESVQLDQELRPMVGIIGNLMSGDDIPQLNVTILGTDLHVSLDRDQIHGVLWNLVRNAWQAGEHTRIEISLSADSDTMACLQIADHGCGIAPEEVDRIFEPFYTTKEKGSGLGLATVSRVIADHGGHIEVDSKIGQGTTVRVFLPTHKN